MGKLRHRESRFDSGCLGFCGNKGEQQIDKGMRCYDRLDDVLGPSVSLNLKKDEEIE